MLGRKTYEGLAGYGPSQSGTWADMVNATPKHVGSNTLSRSTRTRSSGVGETSTAGPLRIAAVATARRANAAIFLAT